MKDNVGEESILLLLSFKEALGYYKKIASEMEFDEVNNGFIIRRKK